MKIHDRAALALLRDGGHLTIEPAGKAGYRITRDGMGCVIFYDPATGDWIDEARPDRLFSGILPLCRYFRLDDAIGYEAVTARPQHQMAL